MKQSEKVKEFHEAYGLPVVSASAPFDNRDTSRLKLRLSLIAEELSELFEATLGTEEDALLDIATDLMNVRREHCLDFVEMADALGDLLYVVNGMALEFGIPLDDVFDEIHRSNMSKLGEDGKPIYRADGKVLKGPGFFQPSLFELVSPEHGSHVDL